MTVGYSMQEHYDADTSRFYESIAELRERLDETPLR